MSIKRNAALLGLGALVVGTAVLLMHERVDLAVDASSNSEPVSPASSFIEHQQSVGTGDVASAPPAMSLAVPKDPAEDNPVYLDSVGVVERLQVSRHGFFSPSIEGFPELSAFRFTLDRQPLTELAATEQTVAWPINDGGSEFVKLHTLREQDGNLFIAGEVVEGGGQFTLVMTADNSVSGQLLTPRGMYSYSSQLDEIVGQRVDRPVRLD